MQGQIERPVCLWCCDSPHACVMFENELANRTSAHEEACSARGPVCFRVARTAMLNALHSAHERARSPTRVRALGHLEASLAAPQVLVRSGSIIRFIVRLFGNATGLWYILHQDYATGLLCSCSRTQVFDSEPSIASAQPTPTGSPQSFQIRSDLTSGDSTRSWQVADPKKLLHRRARLRLRLRRAQGARQGLECRCES